MLDKIDAVAFDIDGTLYPSWKLYIQMPLYVLKNLSFYLKFSKVRSKMHKTAPLADFYEYQARTYAEMAGISSEEAKEIINKISYDGLKPFFRKIKPYSHAYECMVNMKNAGLKIGILSDFPPGQKEEIWGMRKICDVCIGSEESGALKPSIYPFGILSQKLGVPMDRILYVGNSHKYDVLGAKNAGMKTAYILKGIKKTFNIKNPEADISFRNYRQLEDEVLKASRKT